MAFDKSKPYDEIFGKTEDNARYVQSGVRYSPQGEQVGTDPGWVASTEAAAPAKPSLKNRLSVGRGRPATMSHDKENRDALKAEELSE